MRAEPAPIVARAVRIPDGSIEALKWAAVLCMVVDHINHFLLNFSQPAMYAIGRLSLPLFVFVLAYNLARPGIDASAYRRTLKRLALYGTAAAVPFTAMRSPIELLPLNVMFMLLVTTAAISMLDARPTPMWARALGAATVAAFGGAFVEFWWIGVLGGLAAWWYCRSGSIYALVAAIFVCASLFLVNGNGWSLAAIPFIAWAMRRDFRVPRMRWFFYAFYPAHLYVLWLLKASGWF